MSFEQKDLSGSLFRNTRKSEERHADYTGTCTIGGEQFRINAWIKTSAKSGVRYMSLSFREKEPEVAMRKAGSASTVIDLDDEVPFAPEFR